MALRRRHVLASIAAGTAAVPGCFDVLDGVGNSGSSSTGTPSPKSVAEVGCPDSGADNVVCSHDPPEDSLVFEPEPTVAELPAAEITCRLENTGDETLESNFYRYGFMRYRDGRWWDIGPKVVPLPLHMLPPGDTHVRTVLVDNTDLERVRPPDDDTDGYSTSRIGLGPGAYALSVGASADGDSTSYVAAFTLEGEPVPLVAPETVSGTTREGNRVIVDVDSLLEDHDTDRFTIRVSRDPDPLREPTRLIDEQLYLHYNAGLRTAFAHVDDDVETVEVRGDDSSYSRNLASGSGPRFIEYDGETYRVKIDPYAE